MDISAHKFILAARSPVMKQLIQEESFGGTIPIDFDVNPFESLQWMYTGKLTSEATGP
ncbi:TD and POZ domain-containing protein 3 [Orchesella cincta]|uniref:TD and POZ domain-containing protein 3 n=1 Tax=Orchesella cincta TaxID=48709 RepID=A0A1D2M4H2_ORCCI|nr:TD and POZ domain-containing protein 3 [Orchesella cincta]